MEIFRKEALERMQSPDSLDQLLVVVTPKSWIFLATIFGLCGVALVWSVVGEIPVSVDGFGVLINPGNVRGIQSDVSGQLTELHIRVGDTVNRGDVIAEINQPELRQQLEQADLLRQGQARLLNATSCCLLNCYSPETADSY